MFVAILRHYHIQRIKLINIHVLSISITTDRTRYRSLLGTLALLISKIFRVRLDMLQNCNFVLDSCKSATITQHLHTTKNGGREERLHYTPQASIADAKHNQNT